MTTLQSIEGCERHEHITTDRLRWKTVSKPTTECTTLDIWVCTIRQAQHDKLVIHELKQDKYAGLP